MNRYAFILGHVPVLSSIEAKILIPDLALESFRVGVLFANHPSLDSAQVVRKSGGLVKIAREYAQSSASDLAGIIVAALQEAVPSGKITFGISVYDESADFRSDRLAMQIKNVLKAADRSVRHVHSKTEALNTATLLFNEFEKPGHIEVCLVPFGGTNDRISICITEAFQDLGEYSDLERVLGARDDRSGVLPLRLVKMLLNIAGVENEHTLLDPFCGSGILVGVAAARGTKHVFASDISTKAVHDTQRNFGALRGLVNSEKDWKAEECDAREISKKLSPASIDRIVTEPYLGPSNRAASLKEREELSRIYVDSFREFKKVLKPDGNILFIFPVFESEHDFTRAQSTISQMGFAKVDLMKDVREFFSGVSEPIYSRPQQRVKRLITLWKL